GEKADERERLHRLHLVEAGDRRVVPSVEQRQDGVLPHSRLLGLKPPPQLVADPEPKSGEGGDDGVAVVRPARRSNGVDVAAERFAGRIPLPPLGGTTHTPRVNRGGRRG